MRWSRHWTHSLCGVRASTSTLKMNCRSRKIASSHPTIPKSNPSIYFNYLLNDLWIRTFLFLYCLKCKINNIDIFVCCLFVLFHFSLHTSTWVYLGFFVFPSSDSLGLRKGQIHFVLFCTWCFSCRLFLPVVSLNCEEAKEKNSRHCSALGYACSYSGQSIQWALFKTLCKVIKIF